MQALKDNQALPVPLGCYGVSRIAKKSIFTGTNNFMSDTITNSRLNKYFVFVQSGVDQLLNDAGLTEQAFLTISEEGMMAVSVILNVYCPWDVMNYMLELRNPESQTGQLLEKHQRQCHHTFLY